jgi:exonuclease III
MFKSENSYALCKFLEEQNPDIMFLNETWHQGDQSWTPPNRNYNCLLSTANGERAGGVAIVFKSSLIVVPLSLELHTRNLLLARLSSATAFPVILICIYFPPDQERKTELMPRLARIMEFIKNRFSSHSIFGCGDLNADLQRKPHDPNAKKMARTLKLCDLTPREGGTHQSSGRQRFLHRLLPCTWSRSLEGDNQKKHW